MHLKAYNTTGNRTIKNEIKRAEDPQIECRMIQNRQGYIGQMQVYANNRLEWQI